MEEGSPQRILVAVGAYAPVNQSVYWNHIEFAMNEMVSMPKGWKLGWHVWRRTPLTVFRSDAARIAMEEGFDWLFFLDDDLVVKVTHGESLLKKMIDRGKSFLTTVVLHRQSPHIPMLFLEEDDNQGFCPLVEWPKDRVSEIDITHLACTLLHVNMLRAVKSREPELFDMIGAGSDDIRFCRRVREHTGMKPWLDPTIETRHLGKEVWITEDVFHCAFGRMVSDGPSAKELARRLTRCGFRPREVKARPIDGPGNGQGDPS